MDEQQRFIDLSWLLLEHKWRYYVGVTYGVEPVSDAEYDELEGEYIILAGKLGLQEYTNRAVGFPSSRASAKLVDIKMRKLYNIKDKQLE